MGPPSVYSSNLTTGNEFYLPSHLLDGMLLAHGTDGIDVDRALSRTPFSRRCILISYWTGMCNMRAKMASVEHQARDVLEPEGAK